MLWQWRSFPPQTFQEMRFANFAKPLACGSPARNKPADKCSRPGNTINAAAPKRGLSRRDNKANAWPKISWGSLKCLKHNILNQTALLRIIGIEVQSPALLAEHGTFGDEVANGYHIAQLHQLG